ncbi:MAG TPA: tetratricopeptide repeat protein, partial [Terriglobales bacterium]|nr:tetratricopeptide repeat protein [Terriglobales bacterium]
VDAHAADVNTRLEYARLLAYSRRFTQAMEQYQVILNADPNSAAALVGIAKLTSWQNELPRALAQFDHILTIYPNLYDAQVGKAFTLLWMGKDVEARPLFEQAARRDPSDPDVARALKLLQSPGMQQARVAPGPPSTPPLATPSAVAPAPPIAPPQPAVAPPATPVASTAAASPLQQQAETAAARQDYPLAIQSYRELLRQDPQNREYRLRLARVLSWSKDYAGSVGEYDSLLQATPGDLQAQVERARVLSWERNFDASIAGYRGALRQLEANPPAAGAQPAISSAEIELELARVLSWTGRYQESLDLLNQLLPPGHQPQTSDGPALVEKARVLSYRRQYAQAIVAYDQAIALNPQDYDARIGRAQTVYWQGNLGEAKKQLRAVLAEQPRNGEAHFVLAAIEHGLGNNGSALSLLQEAPADNETRQLKSDILLEQRPVLRVSYGFEDDREIDASGPQTTIKPLRYTAAMAFNVFPNLRMEVENTIMQVGTSNAVLAQFGGDALATSTLARLNFRVAPWFRITAGAGEATMGEGAFLGNAARRRQHFIYEFHPVLTSGGFRLDLTATRQAFPYTPLAVHSNVMQTRESAAPSYEWRRRLRMGVEYWHAQYSLETPDPAHPAFGTGANGGSAFLTPILHQGERLTVEAGMRYDSFAYQNSVVFIDNPLTGIGSAGFFTPRLYQRYAGTGLVAWRVHKKVSLDLHGTFGPHRVFGFSELMPPPAKWGTTGSAGSRLTLQFARWQPFFAYDFFSTNTPAGPALPQGSYRSHLFVTGFSLRF